MKHIEELALKDYCECGEPRRFVQHLKITHTDEYGRVRQLQPVPATFLPPLTDPYATGMLCEVRRAH